MIGNAATVAVLLVGGYRVANGGLELGVLTSFLLYLRQFYDPMQDIGVFYNSLQSATAALEKIATVLAEPPSVPEPETPTPLATPARGALSLQDVSFGYRADRPVLPELSLEIPAGQTVALVGATGAGKTTIAKLISRFYDPTSGIVRLDGVDLRDIADADLRTAVVMITQDGFLFSGSVADNIGFGRLGAGREEIVAAARAVGAHEFISALPEGYDTDVRKRGGRLSAGQRQLVAFARAFLADPAVLILDEATSSLDVPTERAVQRALRTVLAERTALIIAHRLSTVEIADRVLVLADGVVIEDGTPEALVDGRRRPLRRAARQLARLAGLIRQVRAANATAAAVATFSESTPLAIGIRTRSEAAAIAASVRPGPSAPSSTAQRAGTRTSRSGTARASGVRASTSNPWSRRSESGHGSGSTANGTRSTCPIDTRTLRRYSGSAHRSSSSTASTPNAAALRNSAPRFSKSLSPSSTAIRRVDAASSAGSSGPGRSADASTPRVTRKPDDLRQQPLVEGVHRHVQRLQHRPQRLDPGGDADDRPDAVRRGHQPLHHVDALGDDDAAPVGPHVGVHQVTEVVDARVGGRADLDELHAGQRPPSRTSTSPIAAGTPCTTRMRRDTVSAPTTAATTTQISPYSLNSKDASLLVVISDQTSAPARNPLYKPWFLASAALCSACSAVVPKMPRPRGVVQRNASRYRNRKCSSATTATSTSPATLIRSVRCSATWRTP